MRSWRRKSKRSNDESRANEKTVKEFYQTNYGNGEVQPITSERLTSELEGSFTISSAPRLDV